MRYAVRFISYAEEQLDHLSADVRDGVYRKVAELAVDPTRGAVFDRSADMWSVPFDDFGIILYVISENIATITVLRITWLGD